MFSYIVQNLSFSPQAAAQLTYYMRRLRKENVTRKFSTIASVLLIGLQLAIIWTPTVNVNASTDNDIVFGGLNSSDPRGDLLNIYDADRDSAGHTGFRSLFKHFNIERSDLEKMELTSINSSDHTFLSLGRKEHFAEDTPVTVSGGKIETTNPYSCPSHPQIAQPTSGDCVKHLQWYLNHKFGQTLGEDGSFGPATDRATRSFQRQAQLDEDGIVGPLTWSKLHELAPTKAKLTNQTYYLRPLYLWVDNTDFPALAGHKQDGTPFWILLDCGNLVVKQSPPIAPPPPPATTPPPPPSIVPPTSPPTALPPAPLTPQIEQSKAAAYINQAASLSSTNAAGTIAKAGDTILYSLTTTNTGKGTQKDYVVTEDIADVLEYADVTDTRGGTLKGQTLTWPKQTIAAGATSVRSFVIKVKDPVPATPQNQFSYDLRMDNVYGDSVHINVAPPPAKQIEAAVQPLPRTGTGTSLLVVCFFTALSFYFYLRNRQLMREVKILRVDHNPGV